MKTDQVQYDLLGEVAEAGGCGRDRRQACVASLSERWFGPVRCGVVVDSGA